MKDDSNEHGLRSLGRGTTILALALPLIGMATVLTGNTGPETELDAFVVTATRTEREQRLAPASVSLVSGSDFQMTSSQSLLEGLRGLTGLNFQGEGLGGRKVLQLRGMESQHTLVLVNGRRVSATDDVVGHSDFQYDWVPMQAIRRVEVIRGPMSALYGSEAMGGVINIITEDGGPRWTGDLTASAQIREDGRGGEDLGFGFNAAGPLGGSLNLRVSGGMRELNETPLVEQPEISEAEGIRSASANLALDWQPLENHRFEFSATITEEERLRSTNNRGRPPVHQSNYDLSKRQIGLSWFPQFGAWSGQVNAYESDIDVVNWKTEGQSPSTPQFLNDRVIDFHFYRSLGERHQIAWGGEWRREALTHAAFSGGKGSAEFKALYIQDEWALRPDLSLTAAGRLDDHEFFGSEFSPRAYLVWQAGESVVVKGGVGTGFKAPTLKQNSPEYRFDGFHSFMGNGDLNPETSTSYELSVLYEPSPSLSLSLTGFRNNVEDLIGTEVVGALGPRSFLFQYVNFDETRIDGLETEVNWSPSDRWDLRLRHSWLDARDLTHDRSLPDRPDQRFSGTLRWDIVPTRLAALFTGEYNGGFVKYSSSGGVIDLPGYTIFNLNLNWNWSDRQSLVFTARNLGDTDLVEKSDDFNYAEPGRSYGIRWISRF